MSAKGWRINGVILALDASSASSFHFLLCSPVDIDRDALANRPPYLTSKVGPIQMVRAGTFHVRQLTDRRITKPRKLFESNEILFVTQQQPKAVL